MNYRDGGDRGMGLLTGVVIGLGLSLLMPEEWRQKAKDKLRMGGEKAKDMFENSELYDKMSSFYENNSQKAQQLYTDVTDTIRENLDRMGLSLNRINKKKYGEIIDQALERLQEDHQLPDTEIKTLRKYLTEDYSRMESAARSS